MKSLADCLPEAAQAAQAYHQEVGSSLTQVSLFERNPFSTAEHQTASEVQFAQQTQTFRHFCTL